MLIDQILQFVGRAHPLVLHMPIGLALGLLGLEAVMRVRRRPLDPAARTVFAAFAGISGVVAAATGLLLSREDAYGGETLDLHKWLGLGASGACVLVALLAWRRCPRAYAAVLLLACGVLLPAGHLGGTMTHGDGFLTEPFRTPGSAALPADAAPDSEYATIVAPILSARCSSCHGPTRAKGGLRLHTPEGILDGGDSGSALEPGDTAQSEILVRMRLPLDDKDHMPPRAKRQPTAAEIEAIERWIAVGADFTAPPRQGTTSPVVPAEVAEIKPVPEPPREAVDRLTAAQAHVETLDPESGLLWVDFGALPTLDDAAGADLLAPLAPFVGDLSLARTKTGDGILATVASMAHLRRLDLSGTAVTGAGLKALADLPELVELRVTRTALGADGAATIGSLAKLERVFVWESGLTEESLAGLRAARPALRIETGAVPGETPLETEPAPALSNTAAAPGVKSASLDPVNSVCPVSGQAVNSRYLVVHAGRVVGFCCEKCAAKFLAEPEKFTVTSK